MVLSTPDKDRVKKLYDTVENGVSYTIKYFNGFEIDFKPWRNMFILKSRYISFILFYCDRDIDELIQIVSSEPDYFMLYMIQNGIAYENNENNDDNIKVVITYGDKTTIYNIPYYFNKKKDYYYLVKINILNTYKMDIERIRMPYY
jgi:hypothetical protein